MKPLHTPLLAAATLALLGSIAFFSPAPTRAAEAQPADGSSVVVADALVGEWLGVVEGEKRTRTLIVESIEAAPDGTFAMRAIYGWTDGARVPSPTKLSVEPSGTTINIFTPSKNNITAVWTAPERFDGTFDLGTKQKAMVLTKREPGNDDKPQPVKAVKKITVLYVGADDCPSCDKWKRRNTSAEAELMKSVELRQVQARQYSHIEVDWAWPDDLKPIRDRLKLKSGTPRFVVLADNKVVLHRFGQATWDKDVLPKLAELQAARKGGK